MTTDQLLAELEVQLSARRERKMGDYKVVPVEPTAEMVEALKARLTTTSRGGILNAGHALADAISAAPAVQGEQISHDWDDQDKCRRCGDRDWYASATCTPKQQPTPTPTFRIGDHVRKTKGSQWKGRVVGTYRTSLTPEGYAVESDTEKGSVQIYPVGALELVGEWP